MLRSIFLTFLLLALPISSNAGIAQVPVTSYTGLNFNITNMSAAGLSSACTELKLDVTGAIANSGKFSAYGAVNCPAIDGSYSLSGSGYLTTGGYIAFTFNMIDKVFNCEVSTSTWGGTCTIIKIYPWSTLGTATVTYLP